MADMKTKETDTAPEQFIDSIEDEEQRDACKTLSAMMQRVVGEPPKMWGESIVGFGRYHYRYESGREGDWFLAGFSPRKGKLSIYVPAGFDRYPHLMNRLGKYKTGKSCLYVKRLDDVDLAVLESLVESSSKHVSDHYAT